MNVFVFVFCNGLGVFVDLRVDRNFVCSMVMIFVFIVVCGLSVVVFILCFGVLVLWIYSGWRCMLLVWVLVNSVVW